MAKPIPKKKTTSRQKIIDQQVELFHQATAARGRIAREAFNAQDLETRKVIDTMVDRLRIISTGYIRVFPEGKMNPSVAIPIDPDHQAQNLLFVAMEILKDLALLDVRVANYQFPKIYCAECGERVTPAKRRRKVKA